VREDLTAADHAAYDAAWAAVLARDAASIRAPYAGAGSTSPGDSDGSAAVGHETGGGAETKRRGALWELAELARRVTAAHGAEEREGYLRQRLPAAAVATRRTGGGRNRGSSQLRGMSWPGSAGASEDHAGQSPGCATRPAPFRNNARVAHATQTPVAAPAGSARCWRVAAAECTVAAEPDNEDGNWVGRGGGCDGSAGGAGGASGVGLVADSLEGLLLQAAALSPLLHRKVSDLLAAPPPADGPHPGSGRAWERAPSSRHEGDSQAGLTAQRTGPLDGDTCPTPGRESFSVERTAAVVGVGVWRGGVKGEARAMEKLLRSYECDPARLTDVCRKVTAL
jgi:hypothetical protein